MASWEEEAARVARRVELLGGRKGEVGGDEVEVEFMLEKAEDFALVKTGGQGKREEMTG